MGWKEDSRGMQYICEWTTLLIVRPTMEPPVLPISTTVCLKADDFDGLPSMQDSLEISLTQIHFSCY